VTMRWENRVFAFLLALSEVNTFLIIRYFVPPQMAANKQFTLLGFRRALGWQCVHNELADQRQNGPGSPLNEHERVHELRMAPKHASKYVNRRWVTDAPQMYQQHRCTTLGCKKRVRTFCTCTPGMWLCNGWHTNHCIRVQYNSESD
jgi:hypothetical protein